jgi:hypothetical protein
MFSDWRRKPMADYATNVAPCDYYTGSKSTSMRKEQYDGYFTRIGAGDTLVVGVDYYALHMSSMYFPPELLKKMEGGLIGGRVYYFRVYREEDMIVYGWIL